MTTRFEEHCKCRKVSENFSYSFVISAFSPGKSQSLWDKSPTVPPGQNRPGRF
jgi:hypothetical protein